MRVSSRQSNKNQPGQKGQRKTGQMKVAEMREKRAALAAQALEVASTDAAKFERIMADVVKLKSDIDRTERAEALNAELRQTARPPLESVGEVRNEKQNAEHRKAFNAFLRSGENSEQFRTYAPKLFAKEFGDGIALTEQERYFSDVLLDAADIHRQTGAWPTVSEVYDRWEQENHAAQRTRSAS